MKRKKEYWKRRVCTKKKGAWKRKKIACKDEKNVWEASLKYEKEKKHLKRKRVENIWKRKEKCFIYGQADHLVFAILPVSIVNNNFVSCQCLSKLWIISVAEAK